MTIKAKCPKCLSDNTAYSEKRKLFSCADCDNKFAPESEIKLKRIFLSYGNDEYAEIAERLKNDLTSRGHEVWYDKESLKYGTDWEHYIEKGINKVSSEPEKGLMIFLATPHSARRPDGFCLNELSRAITRKISIIPVMIIWCELPISICRIQYMDMRNSIPLDQNEDHYVAGFDRLLKAIEHDELDYEGTHTSLMGRLGQGKFSCDADMERHLEHFEGRKWIIDAIDEWLANENASRIFWITGKPGSGKSAMAAWLCRRKREIAAFHMCEHGHTYKADPHQCVQSIAWQLSTQLHEYQERLSRLDLDALMKEANAETLFDSLIVQPLSYNFPKPDRKIIVLIDALDEANEGQANKLAEFLTKMLAKMPIWFRMIVTSRPDPQVKFHLQAFTPFETDIFAEENRKDIREYLSKHLVMFCGDDPVPEKAISTLIERSEGIFLYVHCILEELKQGQLSLNHLDDFPQGLGGYYARFFSRQFPLDAKGKVNDQPDIAVYKSFGRPLLEIMVSAKESLTIEYISCILGWDSYQTKEIPEMFGALILTDNELLRPFHRTLLEWLTDKSKSGHYYVDMGTGHKTLANAGWKEYEHAFDTISEYSKKYLLNHLIALKQWGKVENVLSNPNMIRFFTSTDSKKYLLTNYWRNISTNLSAKIIYQNAIKQYINLKASSNDIIDFTMKIHQIFYALADYNESLDCAKNALTIADENPKTMHQFDIGRIYRSLAQTNSRLGHYQDAESYFLKELSAVKAKGLNDQAVAEILNELGQLYMIAGRLGEAKNIYDDAIKKLVKSESAESHYPNLAIAIKNYATLLYTKNQNIIAEEICRKAIDLHINIWGEHQNTAVCFNLLGMILCQTEKYNESEQYYKKALAIYEKTLGPSHPDTAVVLGNLGDLFLEKNDLNAAEEMLSKSLRILERVFEKNTHIDIANIFDRLGRLAKERFKYDVAEDYYRKSLSIKEKYFSPNHPGIAHSYQGIATALLFQDEDKNMEKAEALFYKSLEIYDHTFGKDHFLTGGTLYCLARISHKKGDFALSEQLYKKSLDMCKKKLPPDSLRLADILHDYSIMLVDQNKLDSAEPLLKRSLSIREQQLGYDSTPPITFDTLNELSNLYRVMGDDNNAEIHYRKMLDIREKTLGPDHPATALNYYNLSIILHDKCNYEESESFAIKSLCSMSRIYGANHSETIKVLDNFIFGQRQKIKIGCFIKDGIAYMGGANFCVSEEECLVDKLSEIARQLIKENNKDLAFQLYYRAVLISEENVNGNGSVITAKALNELAVFLHESGYYNDTLPLFEKALSISEKQIGKDHHLTASIIHNLACTLSKLGKNIRAEELFRETVSIRENVLGLDHTETARSLHNLAFEAKKNGNPLEAEKIYKRALEIREKKLGPEHPDVSLTLYELACFIEDSTEAEMLFKRAITIDEKNYGSDNAFVADSLSHLAKLYCKNNNFTQAKEVLNRAFIIYEKSYGLGHPFTEHVIEQLLSIYDK